MRFDSYPLSDLLHLFKRQSAIFKRLCTVHIVGANIHIRGRVRGKETCVSHRQRRVIHKRKTF